MHKILRFIPIFVLLTIPLTVYAIVPAGNLPAGAIGAKDFTRAKKWVIPNGRIIRPTGDFAFTDIFPLGVALTPNQRHLIITCCANGKQYVDVYSASDLSKESAEPIKAVFNGVTTSNDGRTVWVCGGGNDLVWKYQLDNGKLIPDKPLRAAGFPTSPALSPDGSRLYVTCNLMHKLRVFNTQTGNLIASINTGLLPFGIAITPDGKKGYVTNWASNNVSVVDLKKLKVIKTLPAGGLPCDVKISPDGKMVCVANANTDSLTLISVPYNKVLANIRLHPYPNSPYGSIPNGLVFSPNGKAVFVTLAGNNAVAEVSLQEKRIIGMIPTAWYPTNIVMNKAGNTLYVVNSKGAGSGPNNGKPLSDMMRGIIQKIPIPNFATLKKMTADVVWMNGFHNSWTNGNRSMGDLPRNIKHVVFIVRENRTYDQDLGDLGYANGDPKLTFYGRKVTPNLHALAKRYAISDNMFGDGEVSVQGHQWTLGALCPDYTEKTWTTLYSGRGRLLDWLNPTYSYPVLGYMMDHCVQYHVSCRMYGDVVRRGANGLPLPDLRDKIDTHYIGWDLSYPDRKRALEWEREFNKGIFREFTYIWLPNDHTAGANPKFPTPQAMVADNDHATGMVIQTLSHSPEWKNTVVFLTEDDSQDGHDHVDAHRNILFIAGGMVKPHAVAVGHLSFGSIYATIERFLKIPPMSQYDDLADPVHGIWTKTPNLKPYVAIEPNYQLSELNPSGTELAMLSKRLKLDEPDENTGSLMEYILWRCAVGANTGR